MTISDIFDSGKEYIKSKFTNPLFGTIIAVWVIRNWKVWYGIFSFDEQATQIEKIKYVDEYFAKVNWTCELIICIGFSFGVLVISYLLLTGSKFLLTLYEEKLMPWAYSVAPKSKMVERTDLEESQRQVRGLHKEIREKELEALQQTKRWEDERIQASGAMLADRERLENEIKDLTLKLNTEVKSKASIPREGEVQGEYNFTTEEMWGFQKKSENTELSKRFNHRLMTEVHKDLLLNTTANEKSILEQVFVKVLQDDELAGQCQNLIEAIKEKKILNPESIIIKKIIEQLRKFDIINVHQTSEGFRLSWKSNLGQIFPMLISKELEERFKTKK